MNLTETLLSLAFAVLLCVPLLSFQSQESRSIYDYEEDVLMGALLEDVSTLLKKPRSKRVKQALKALEKGDGGQSMLSLLHPAIRVEPLVLEFESRRSAIHERLRPKFEVRRSTSDESEAPLRVLLLTWQRRRGAKGVLSSPLL